MSSDQGQERSAFPPTRWSLVRTASEPEALEEICRSYWRPIYHFLRRSGHTAEDAEDLTQSFFSSLIDEQSLDRARREEGKLRSFLLGVLKRHVSSAMRHRGALKRGGGSPHVPLSSPGMEFSEAEQHYVVEPSDELTPDWLFERRWVFDLLMRAHQRLQRDYEAAGKNKKYQLLKGAVMTSGELLEASEVARQLEIKEASVRVLTHRLRRNFRAAFKDEIAETVTNRAEVEAEYRHLLKIFS